MENLRKRLAWPWLAGTFTLAPVLYVLSFGPAVWLMDRTGLISIPLVARAYRPVIWAAINGPDSVHPFVRSYAHYGCSAATRKYGEIPVFLNIREVQYYGLFERLQDAAQIPEK